MTSFKHGNTIFLDPELILSVHVDNILLTGKTQGIINTFKVELNKLFKIKDLGPTQAYLRIQIEQNLRQKTIKISQTRYLQEMIRRYNLKQINPNLTSLPAGLRIDTNTQNYDDHELKADYQLILGNSTYLIQTIRLDIAYTISLISRFLVKPTHTHRKLLKDVLRYLKDTAFLDIIYKHNTDAKLNLETHTNTD